MSNLFIQKVKNTITYRKNLIKTNYIHNIKFGNVKNKVIKNLAARDYLYKKLRKKYSKYVKINTVKSAINDTKKIWICWFQGKQNAPELVQQCISSVEKNLNDYEVIVLTWDNYKEYVNIPDYIMKLYSKKIITIVHLSDIIRMNVLIEHGGLWLDSTVLCTCQSLPEYMKNESLFVYKEIGLDLSDKSAIAASSWLIYASKNNNILKATQDMLYAYWKKEKYLKDYFLFHIFFKIATELYEDEWNNMPAYNNVSPHMLQFELEKKYVPNRWNQLISMSDFHKLNRHNNYSNKDIFTNYDYIINGLKENNKK